MTTKRTTTIAVGALLLLVVAVVTGYLLYAVPASDADRLNHKVATLKSQDAKLVDQLAAAKRSAHAAWSRAAKEYVKGRAAGMAAGRKEGLAEAGTSYDKGFADGSAAAFGTYGSDWASGSFYVIRVEGGQIVARTVLQPCLAVYADRGTVWVQGPAC
jgi:outer membrane murein-binding lipoprotein Lpp